MPSRPDRSAPAGDPVPDEPLRVGLLVPSSNSVLEPALWRRLPDWAALHAARLFVTESSAAAVRGIHDAIPEAARLLATVRPHLVAVGCTSVSGLDDGALERTLAPGIQAATGAEVITVLPGVVATLRAAGCSSVVLVAPHGPEVDAVVVRGLEAAGIAVREVHSMGIADNFALGRVLPRDIARFVLDRVGALRRRDALFLTCTNFRSVDVLPGLRRRYGPRVFSSVGVLIDQTLDRLGRLRAAATRRGRAGAPRERTPHGA
jgi:maleate isomerase